MSALSKKKSSSVKCVRIVEAFVYDSKGKVLLLKRSSNNSLYKGKWQLPGGKVRKHESPRHAIKREISEELNCGCVSLEKIAELTFFQKHAGVDSCVELFIFACKVKGRISLSDEHSDKKLFNPKKFSKKLLTPISRVSFSLK
jgi:8-oxo-dGTP diphosphatase